MHFRVPPVQVNRRHAPVFGPYRHQPALVIWLVAIGSPSSIHLQINWLLRLAKIPRSQRVNPHPRVYATKHVDNGRFGFTERLATTTPCPPPSLGLDRSAHRHHADDPAHSTSHRRRNTRSVSCVAPKNLSRRLAALQLCGQLGRAKIFSPCSRINPPHRSPAALPARHISNLLFFASSRRASIWSRIFRHCGIWLLWQCRHCPAYQNFSNAL